MSNPYLRSYDDLLAAMLVDYGNLSPAPDITVGSPVYIKCSVLASAIWGIYKYQDWLAQQPFPDTADTDNLNHLGSMYGISRISGENDNDYAARIINFMRVPPAGGTLVDYQNWALECPATTVADLESFLPGAVNTVSSEITLAQDWNDGSLVTFTSTGTLPAPLVAGTQYALGRQSATQYQVYDSSFSTQIVLTTQGTGLHTVYPDPAVTYSVEYAKAFGPPTVTPGQVVVVVLPDDEGILGTGAMDHLLAAVLVYVDARRPASAALTDVVAASPIVSDVTITVKPITAPVATIQSDIVAYMDTLAPGDTLYLSKLEAIAIQDGAYDAVVSVPAVDVVPTVYQVIRPGIITVTPSA